MIPKEIIKDATSSVLAYAQTLQDNNELHSAEQLVLFAAKALYITRYQDVESMVLFYEQHWGWGWKYTKEAATQIAQSVYFVITNPRFVEKE